MELRNRLDVVEQTLVTLRAITDDAVSVELTVIPPASGGRRPSVRTMALALMEEEDRDWSTGEILTEYRRRGTPVHGTDPNNALRAALADAKKRRLVYSTGVIGRYKSAKWQLTPVPGLNGAGPATPAETEDPVDTS